MDEKEIIKIASATNHFGLKNDTKIKAKVRNKTCGDEITVEISEDLKEVVDEANEYIDNKLKTQILFDDKYTKLFPIPQKFSERIYVPAPSGSGKSTFIGMYIQELRK